MGISVHTAPGGVAAAAAERHGDLADMPEAEFERGIARAKLRRERLDRIIKEVLIPERHFGRADGAFKKPILFQAGSQEIRQAFRLAVVRTDAADVIVETPDYSAVVVTRAIVDANGRVLAVRTGACSSAEKRFEKRTGKGMTWGTDARAALHDCLAMAEKRAGTLLTVEATGIGGIFATEDDVLQAAGTAVDRPLEKWTAGEKEAVGKAAKAKGMGKDAFSALVLATLGRAEVGTGEDVVRVLAAIEAWAKPTSTPPGSTQSNGDLQGLSDDRLAAEYAAAEAAGNDPEMQRLGDELERRALAGDRTAA